MSKFKMVMVHKGETTSQEVSEDVIYNTAMELNGGGYTEKDTANAILWVNKVRNATVEHPVVLRNTKDDYLAVYAESPVKEGQ